MTAAKIPNALTRVATALVGIPIVVYLTYVGGWPFLVLILGISLIAQYELYQMLAQTGAVPLMLAGMVLGALVGIRTLLPLPMAFAGVAVGLLLLSALLLRRRTGNPVESLAYTLLGVLYPTLLLTFLIDLRSGAAVALGETHAFWLTLSVFVLVWVSDTAAYYSGKLLGRHKLAPSISPNKTWEGAIGGGIGAIGAALLFGLLVLPFLSTVDCLVLGLICGGVSQLGDLAESKIKRTIGVKDSGALLPGHGGLLDRFDAMIVAAPFAYFYLAFMARVF